MDEIMIHESPEGGEAKPDPDEVLNIYKHKIGFEGVLKTKESFRERTQNEIETIKVKTIRGRRVVIRQPHKNEMGGKEDDELWEVEFPVQDGKFYQLLYFSSDPTLRDIEKARDILYLEGEVGCESCQYVCDDCLEHRHIIEVPIYEDNPAISTIREFVEKGVCGCKVANGEQKATTSEHQHESDHQQVVYSPTPYYRKPNHHPIERKELKNHN